MRPSCSKGSGGLSPFLYCLEKWSGLNRISLSYWVKICDDHNGQINLRAKQKYEVLSATYIYVCVCVCVCARVCVSSLMFSSENMSGTWST